MTWRKKVKGLLTLRETDHKSQLLRISFHLDLALRTYDFSREGNSLSPNFKSISHFLTFLLFLSHSLTHSFTTLTAILQAHSKTATTRVFWSSFLPQSIHSSSPSIKRWFRGSTTTWLLCTILSSMRRR